MSNTASGKHVTVGALKHFAETYTANVFNTVLNQFAATVGSGLSISGNTLSLDNSSGTSLDTISLPNASLSGTTGSSSQPVYLNNGTITACGNSLDVNITGSAAKVGGATVGSANQPVYMNAGTPTACGGSLNVDITGNASNSTKWAGYNIAVVTSLPASPNANTIYIVKN